MADENVIGLKAELDLSDWTPSQKQLEAALAHVNAVIDGATKKAEENAKRVAEAEKKSSDEQEKAHKRAADAAEKAAAQQEKSHQKVAQAVRNFSIAFAITVAAVVKGYEALKREAISIGDKEAIEGFERTDKALRNFKDTLDAVAFAALPIRESLDVITDGLNALSQVATLATAGITKIAVLGLGVLKFVQDFKSGIVSTKDIGTELEKAISLAQKAGEKVIIAGATGPQQAERAKLLADQEKDAQKQREKITQNIHDYNEKIREQQIKSGESILEAEKDFHDKSAEAWQSYMDKVSDITADGIRERAKLARDYSDKIAAAETDYQRGIEDASYNHGKKLADIERDYQNTIRNIQQTYQEDALDAIRNLDAIGFIRAKEKRDKDLANANRSRDEANAAEGENYSRQLYELQRALEDKRREAELAYQRGLEEQKIAEREALQSAKDSYNQQNADTRKALDDKLASIKQSYANENAAAAAQYGYSEAAFRDHLIAMQNIMKQYGIGNVTPPTSPRVNRRAEGGLDVVNTPTQFVAGEAGPEMVYTAPLNRSVPMPVMQTVNHVGDFSHSIDAAISSSVAGLDGRITAVVRKAIAEVIR